MKYVINPQQRPVYLQIYRQIRDDIVAGNYLFGTKLPSKRQLSEETGVSIITIEHAYSLLCEEGYIESKERIGELCILREKLEEFGRLAGRLERNWRRASGLL